MKSRNDLLAERRSIRLRIGRARRRIDRRLRSLEREGTRLVSWRTWARRLPAQSVVAALGAGLANVAGLRKRKLRALALWLARLVGTRSLDAVFRDRRHRMKKPTTDASNASPPPPDGVKHA